MLKIGHRGASGHNAENTIASFQKAIDLGCNGIELDVHRCKTDEIVVIHDNSINRTTNATGLVQQLTLHELRQHNIPTLIEVLDLVNNKLLVNIEIKNRDCTTQVAEIINHYVHNKNWKYSNLLVSSFDWPCLMQIAHYNNQILTAVLTAKNFNEAFDFAKTIKAHAINAQYKLLNQENVTLAHQNNFKIFAWTVNDLSDIEKIKVLKIDGIISDFVDRL